MAARPRPATRPRRRFPRYRRGVSALRSSLFWVALRRQGAWVRCLLALFVLNAVLSFLISRQTTALVDLGIDQQVVSPGDFVRPVTQLILLAVVVGFLAQFVMERIGYQIEYDVRTSAYHAIQNAELGVDRVPVGQVVTRVLTDLRVVSDSLKSLPAFVSLVPLVLGQLLYLLWVNPLIAVIASAGLPVNFWLIHRFSARLKAMSWAELNERAEAAEAMGEPVRGIRVVRAFGREDAERRRVAERAAAVFRYSMTRMRLLARYDVALKLAPAVLQGVFLFAGARLVVGGELSIGTLLLAWGMMTIIRSVAQLLDNLVSQYQYLVTAQRRLRQVLGFSPRCKGFGRPLPPPTRGLELAGVGVQAVISGFDLSVGYGELVVVTGTPGSGKTTVARTAAGLRTPGTGEVLLDGVGLSDLDPVELRKAIRLVGEAPVLFAATLRENLTVAAGPDADDAALRRALRLANAERIVAALPGGLDEPVGDRGLTLSGGERQRLALARALVDPPRVLVLDDALAAVSPSMELAILERIRAELPELAIVCVTRRAGATTIADHVVRLPAPRDRTRTVADTAPAGADMRDLAALESARAIRLSRDVPPPLAGDTATSATSDMITARDVVRPFRGLIGLAVVMLFVSAASGLAPNVLFGGVGDYAREGDLPMIDLLVLGVVGVGLVYALSSYGYRVLSERFAHGLLFTLRYRLFARLSRLGADYYDRESPGQVSAKVVHDLDVVVDFIKGAASELLKSGVLFLAGMAIVVLVGHDAVVLVLMVVLFGLILLQHPVNGRALSAAREQLGRTTATFEEDLCARDEIRALGAEPTRLTGFLQASRELRRRQRSVALLTSGFSAFTNLAAQVLLLVVLVDAGDRALTGASTIGTALALRQITAMSVSLLTGLGTTWFQLLDLRVSWARLKQPFAAPIRPAEHDAQSACPPLSGHRLAVRDLSFTYPRTGHRVLHGVSFAVGPAESLAVVGHTGAGKSSIAKLLLRMYDPDHGAIQIGRTDIRRFDPRTYRRRIGLVPQEAFLFTGTVASNIAYGCPEAGPAEIEAAARAVGVHSLLGLLRRGYEHPVEAEGRNLTAAQRQAVAIARAWLTRPGLLVLDEATSALDDRHEAAVLAAIRRLGCATVLITHREAVARWADRVIVLDAGRVVEQGAPATLLEAGTAFSRLWSVGRRGNDG